VYYVNFRILKFFNIDGHYDKTQKIVNVLLVSVWHFQRF